MELATVGGACLWARSCGVAIPGDFLTGGFLKPSAERSRLNVGVKPRLLPRHVSRRETYRRCSNDLGTNHGNPRVLG